MLKEAISDQNLELIPDYEQRIAVLKELKFIDENSTVLLKGRVACEVHLFLLLLAAQNIFSNCQTDQQRKRTYLNRTDP